METVDFRCRRIDFEFTDELAGREAGLSFLESSNDLSSFETRFAIEITRLYVADALRI